MYATGQRLDALVYMTKLDEVSASQVASLRALAPIQNVSEHVGYGNTSSAITIATLVLVLLVM